MSPIEDGLGEVAAGLAAAQLARHEHQVVQNLYISLHDLFTADLARTLLEQQYDGVHLNPTAGLKALQVGYQILPIETIGTRDDLEGSSFVVQADGSRHQYRESPESIQIQVWSEPDRDAVSTPFSYQFANLPLDSELHLQPIGPAEQTQKYLRGPLGLGAGTAQDEEYILWNIRSPLSTPLEQFPVERELLQSFHALVLANFGSLNSP